MYAFMLCGGCVQLHPCFVARNGRIKRCKYKKTNLLQCQQQQVQLLPWSGVLVCIPVCDVGSEGLTFVGIATNTFTATVTATLGTAEGPSCLSRFTLHTNHAWQLVLMVVAAAIAITTGKLNPLRAICVRVIWRTAGWVVRSWGMDESVGWSVGW